MKQERNSVEIFSLALGLEAPWYVEEVNLVEVADSSTKVLNIRIHFMKGHEFLFDDGHKGKGYDTEEKCCRHLDFFRHGCYLYARVPRVEHSDGKVRQVSVPWARPGSGFTLLFEAFAMLLIKSEMSAVCQIGIDEASSKIEKRTPVCNHIRRYGRTSCY